MNILNPMFQYQNAANTNVRATWERFGFRPTTDADREAARRKLSAKHGKSKVTKIRREAA